MVLAALSFADPLMLAGLMAALVPIFLHLLNRVKAPVVPFPTLRFLKITAQKTARRRQIQQYFLLLVRVVVFALLAMAVAAPLIRGGSAGLAYSFVGMLLGAVALLVLAGVMSAAAIDRGKAGAVKSERVEAKPQRTGSGRTGAYWMVSTLAFVMAMLLLAAGAYGLVSDRFFTAAAGTFTGRSTAVAIILDNSHSMLAKEDAGMRSVRARALARQLLAETLRPAEGTILLTNPGEGASATPMTSDLTRLVGMLDAMGDQPLGRALPMQERIRTGLQMLEASRQPGKMLVIVSDFAQESFAEAGVFAGIKESPIKKDLQLVMVPVAQSVTATGVAPPPADVGIVSFGLAAGSERPVVGAQLTFEAGLINNGDAADVRDVAFTVDGQVVQGATTRVQLGAAGTGAARTTVRIPYRLRQAGMHRFGLQLLNAPDALAWDDSRELVLDVAEGVKVLVAGAEDGEKPRARSAAFYFEAALAPFAGRAGVPWSIQPVYRGAGQIAAGENLAGYSAVFMCDVPKVTPGLADTLLRYVRGGGRVVWVLGPSIDAANYNDVVVGQNRGLLPALLGDPVTTPAAAPVEWVDLGSGLFMNLFESQEPFRTLLVNGRWSLKGEPRGRTLMKLAEGAPLFTEHVPAGAPIANGRATASLGKVYTLLTTPGATWSNLGATVLLVPLASRMALGDAAEAQGARGGTSYDVGDTVMIGLPGYQQASSVSAVSGPAGNALAIDVTTPGSAVVNVRPGLIGDTGQTPRWSFDRALEAGVYRWKSTDARFSGIFVVNPPGAEADLLPADVQSLAREAGPQGLAGEDAAGKPAIVAGTAAEVLAQLEQRGEGTSLLPGFIAMVLMLAVVEALLANRYRPPAQGSGRGVITATPSAAEAAASPERHKPATPEERALAALESAAVTSEE